MKPQKLASCASMAALVIVFSTAAQAQLADQQAQAETGGLTEIVVTAQKKAESLSKTPAAISVLAQNTLDNSGSRSFSDAVRTVPSVSNSGVGGSIAIRGLGTSTIGSASNGTVAFHVDGIFQNGVVRSNNAQYDIARIEVLRGPQGTLYGRNATAGVVNVITNNADPNKFETFGDISYGRWNALTLRGVVNVPVAEDFAVRLTGIYEKSDDWKKKPNGEHPEGRDVLNLRLAWHAKPSDAITWDARLEYTDDRSTPEVGVASYYYDAANDEYIRTSNPRNLATIPSAAGIDNIGMFGAFPSVYKGLTFEEANLQNQSYLEFRSNLNFEISDEASLTYLLGYAYQKTDGPSVISGLQPFQVISPIPVTSNSWSHELNLNYRSDRLSAIFGVYSFERHAEDLDSMTRLFLPTLGPDNFVDYATPLVDVNNGASDEITKTRAIFGQATFDVTDSFRVTGGARYNWDHVSFKAFSQSQCPFGSGVSASRPNEALIAPGVPLCSTLAVTGVPGLFPPGFFYLDQRYPGGSINFEKFSWKLSAEYDLSPDTLLYATVATGYKAGGAADRTQVGDARFFRPETNINYEAGIRAKLFGNTLGLNLTAFWTDYKDLQVQSTDPNNIGQLIAINAGKSRSRGVELEYNWAPTRADRIGGYLTYLDAKYLDFPSVDPLTSQPTNFRGNRLAGAPEFAARFAYSHSFDLGDAGTITPNVQFNYQTKSYVLFANSPASEVPSYTRTDIIVRYETGDKRFSLEGFVNNLENKKILVSMFPQSPVAVGYFSRPLSYGVRAGFRF